MDRDTDIGGRAEGFPQTRRSAVWAARSADPAERRRALDVLVTAYWKPVYKYIRLKWREDNEAAKDLTQGFFAQAVEKDYFAAYDPAKARFRTFLRTCLEGYVANERKAAGRLKRGGGATLLALGSDSREGELSLEEYFQREWVRSLFSLAVEDLKTQCRVQGKDSHFLLFARYDLEEGGAGEGLTYERLATEFGIPAAQVTNYLAWARREFRRIVLERLKEITGGEQEFRDEARLLLGIETP